MTHVKASDLAPDFAWFKSSYSSENGTNCVEVADLRHASGLVGIRDSKQSDGAVLVVPAAAFAAFINSARS